MPMRREKLTPLSFRFLDGREHIQGQGGNGLAMAGFRLRQAAGHRVGITNGLDLFQTMMVRQFVKAEDDLVPFADQLLTGSLTISFAGG